MIAAAMCATNMHARTVVMVVVVVGTVDIGVVLQFAGEQGFYGIVSISLYTAVQCNAGIC